MTLHDTLRRSSGSGRCKILALLVAVLIGAGFADAQVSFTGTYNQNFDGMGTSGTAAPAGWAYYGALGGGNTTWTTSIPASDAGLGTLNATLVASTATSVNSNTQGYNYASASTTADRCLVVAPTTGRGSLFELTLQNSTGAAINSLSLSFDTRRFTAASTANELPGYWLFYSLDNGVSWTNIASLNPTLTTVPNTVGVSAMVEPNLSLASSWNNGSTLRLRWINDNAVETSPDQINGIDNVAIGIGQSPPNVTLTAPAEGASFNLPAIVNLAADADDSDGTVTKVEFLANGIKIGEDTEAPYTFAWSGMLSGNYALMARATDDDGATKNSAVVNVSVANPNNQAPTVTLAAPLDGALIAGDSTILAATAADPDGVIAKVEFYQGTTKIGEATASPYQFNWSGVSTGTYLVKARAIDNDGAAIDSAVAEVTFVVPIQTTSISRRPAGQPGAVWKYLDNGTDQGSAWKEPAFDDSTWASGAAPLGYTDSHIVTTVFSPPTPNRYITTYFRRTFNVTGAGAVQSILLNVLRDDGVVVYINGVEVARQNMPEGPINYLTNSASITDGANETTYFPSTVTTLPPLNEGANVIAVELHQRDGNSSDLGFDLELITNSLPGTPPTIQLTSPAAGAPFTAPATVAIAANAEDNDGSVAKVEFFNGPEKLGEDTEAPFTFSWTMVPQGDYTLTARATDNYGLTATSDPVSIQVGPPNTIFPTVTITSPSNAAEYLAPATVSITATANDADGTVTKVEFFHGTTKLGEDATAPYEFEWTNVPVGSYSLTARATDNLTAATTSAPVKVEVRPNLAPSVTLASPPDAATGLGGAGRVNLTANVSDPEGLPLHVTFYGRPASAPPGEDFTLVTIPDTQFYSENSGGSRFALFQSQTNWIVASKDLLNTKFVAHMGDMVNTASVAQEWTNAKAAMSVIEDPLTTLLAQGMPWGGAPGNHDGTGTEWDTHFGPARFAGKDYYQGNYNNSNRNNYQFFSAGGMDFIVINLAYNSNTGGTQAVMDWADAVLKANPNRRAIVTSHWLIGTSFPPAQSSWGGHGQALYDNLKDNPNLFLMLCGHIHGEGRRADVFEGRTVNTVLQDYQSRSNGGDSWLRYFTFKPSENKIYAYTYKTNTAPVGSPMGGTFETDADSQFTLDYNMAATAPWVDLGTVSLAAGETTATLPWTGLTSGETYEWYAAVSDGVTPVGSASRSFTTGGNAAPSVTLTSPSSGATITKPATVGLAANASDPDGVIAKVEFYNGTTKIGEDATAPYTFSWDAPSGVYSVSARAFDAEGASTDSAAAEVTVSFDIQVTVTGGSSGPAGTVTGGSNLVVGSTANFVANSNTGYTFSHWIVNGSPAGSNPNLNVTVTDGMTVEAVFAFTLQLLHFADAEAGLLASQTAPNLAALVDAFDDDYANTIILAGGDNYIPGPFAAAGTDAIVAATHNKGNNPFAADIEIHNRIGVQASTVGNHEFDFGTNAFSDAINDTNFPYLSANLDFSGDSGISARYQETVGVGGLEEASTLGKKIVPSAVITVNGEKIGLVGATTQIIEGISSTGGVEVKGFTGDGSEANDMTLLASQLQPVINDLTSQGVNKIVLMAHLQQITLEQSLAPLLTGVDIVLAAGSNTRLGDTDDVAVAFPGHAADFAGTYPIVTAGADAKPVLIVNTDNEFTYLGRLVVDFDGNGEIKTSELPGRVSINGAYAATSANVAAAWGVSEGNLATTAFATGTKGAGVKQITDAVQSVIAAKDGDVKGYTNFYLEGERNFVRNQETNLGNLSADANAFVLAEAAGDTLPIVSLKNGGGIRSAIGSVEVGSGAKNPPLANPSAGKPAGGVSLLDIENSMRFNNRLLAFETTPAGLKAILEHGVAVLGNQGRFPQIGGVSFAYDPTRTAGDRITTLSLIGEEGQLHYALYDNGTYSPWAPPVIRLVTLNFLANGGDGYPMKANGTNFRYLLDDGTLGPILDPALDFTTAPSLPSNALGEQKALADFLTGRHATPATAYNVADTGPADDLRIQNLASRSNAVPFDLTLILGGDGTGSAGGQVLASGQRQGYRFTLGETRRVEITGTGASGLQAELLDSSGTVVGQFDGSGELLLAANLAAGDYLLRVLNEGTAAATLDLGIDASQTPFVRPDVAVGTRLTSLVGEEVYTGPAAQQIGLVSTRLAPVRAVATIANRGTQADVMTVRATPGNALFRTVYVSGGENVTADLARGTFETASIDESDDAVQIGLTVTPDRKLQKKGKGKGAKKKILRRTYLSQITAESSTTPVVGDSARVIVTTR